MASLESYLDNLLRHGRACFSRDDIAVALGLKPQALAAAFSDELVDATTPAQ